MPKRKKVKGSAAVSGPAKGVLWSWQELQSVFSDASSQGPDIQRVIIDSRQARPGDLFVALPGDLSDRFTVSVRSDRDGHDYISHAMSNGAAAALVARGAAVDGIDADVPILAASHTLDGLWTLAGHARNRLTNPVVAVTGSSGKTTAKLWMATAFGLQATTGSLNNHIGVPLSLVNSYAGTGAVFEIGTNHPGEIGPLSQLVRPSVSTVLNVQRAHIGNFASPQELLEEKLSIVSGLTADGVAVVPVEHRGLLQLATGQKMLSFGDAADADVRGCELVGDRLALDVFGKRIVARVPGGGVHRAQTLMAVVATAVASDRDLAAVCDLPEDLLPGGRGSISQLGSLVLIDDSYNANPQSMAAALTQLASLAGRSVAMVGEMGELGNSAVVEHEDLAQYCQHLSGVICVGPGTEVLHNRLAQSQQWGYWRDADDSLLDYLIENIENIDNLLIKGSNTVFWANNFVTKLKQRLCP